MNKKWRKPNNDCSKNWPVSTISFSSPKPPDRRRFPLRFMERERACTPFLSRIGTRNLKYVSSSESSQVSSGSSRACTPVFLRIGTRNLKYVSSSESSQVSSGSCRESLHAFFVAHWDQEPEIRKLFGIKPS